jgi:hypothetical protein
MLQRWLQQRRKRCILPPHLHVSATAGGVERLSPAYQLAATAGGLTAAKLVIQLTETATELPAVRPSFGITSGKMTHAIGARPKLNEITNATTERPDRTWLCLFRPIPRSSENSAVKALEASNIRFVVNA